MKKKIMTLALTAAIAASMGMTAFAGQWVQNTTGWWWQEDNGSYPVSQWKWLDGNNDGIYECYAFDSNGYMYADTTTPDGYTVNKEGAWTIGNSVRLKFAKDMRNESGSNDNNTADNSTSDNTVYTNEIWSEPSGSTTRTEKITLSLCSVPAILLRHSTMIPTEIPIYTASPKPAIQNTAIPPIHVI